MTNKDKEANAHLIEALGSYTTDNRLVAFLYELLRDYLTVGQVEAVRRTSLCPETYVLTNGPLAQYAQYVVDTLTQDPQAAK